MAEQKKRVSRAGAAQLLGCSIATVQRLELEKRLTPIHDHGRVFFDREEVDLCDWKPKRARRRVVTSVKFRARGRLEARLLELFRAGRSWQDAVVDTKAQSDFVLECYAKFSKSIEDLAIEAELDRQEREHRKETKSREWREWQLAMKRAGPTVGVPHPGFTPSEKKG